VYWQRLTANTNSISTSDQGNILHSKSIDEDSSQQIKNDGDKLKRDAQFIENIPVVKNVERLPGKCTIFKDIHVLPFWVNIYMNMLLFLSY